MTPYKCPDPRTSRTASPISPPSSARARRPRRSPICAASRKPSAPPAAPTEPRGGMPFATDSAFVGLIESVAAATAKAETDRRGACTPASSTSAAGPGWPVGHVYLAGKREHDPLQPSHVWHLGHPTKFEAFRDRRREHAARRRASACRAASPRPAAPPGSSTSPATPTSRAPRPAPRSACAAPSPSRSRSATRRFAVIECFSLQAVTPDDRLLEVTAHIGRQLGRLIAGHAARPTRCASPRAASARSPSPPPTRSSPPTRTATSSPGTAAPS